MQNLIETAKAAGNFNTLVKACEKCGLTPMLSGADPYTIFAPTDEAFAKIPKEQLDKLMDNKEELTRILKFHVLEGVNKADKVKDMQRAETLEGRSMEFDTIESDAWYARVEALSEQAEALAWQAELLPRRARAQPAQRAFAQAISQQARAFTQQAQAQVMDQEVFKRELDGRMPRISSDLKKAFEARLVNSRALAQQAEALAKQTEAYVGAPVQLAASQAIARQAEALAKQAQAETLSLMAVARESLEGVRVEDASVTMSNIEASNSVIHAIDKILMP